MGNLTTRSNLQKERQLQIQTDQSVRTALKGWEREQRNVFWAKERRVYILEKKKENHAWHLTYELSAGRGPA